MNKNNQEQKWQKLMVSSQNGDSKAYAQLLKEILPLIKNFVKKRVFDASLVDDVTQNALLGIHTARASYNPAQPFTPWLYAIVRYKILDYIRAQQRYSDNISLNDDDFETFCSSATNIQEETDIKKDLATAMKKLPAKQQLIINLIKIQGFTASEVALKLNMSLSAVKVSAFRGYKTLKDINKGGNT